MSSIKNMKCWQITQCNASENCPAKKHPHTPCWELAKKYKTGPYQMNICVDCIVRILKTNDSALDEAEIQKIMEYRDRNPRN